MSRLDRQRESVFYEVDNSNRKPQKLPQFEKCEFTYRLSPYTKSVPVDPPSQSS